MYNEERILSLLDRIESSILLIQSKSEQISQPDDFLLSQDGMFILSGICMQLIFIGESVKTSRSFTSHSPRLFHLGLNLSAQSLYPYRLGVGEKTIIENQITTNISRLNFSHF